MDAFIETPSPRASRASPPRRAVSGGARRVRVLVAADEALVAEAVAAALGTCDLDAVRASPGSMSQAPDVGLLLTQLDAAVALHRAGEVLASGPAHWVVATASPPDALWGAVLDAGAAMVVPTWISLAQLASALQDAATGTLSPTGAERDLLIAQWTRSGLDGAGELARVRSLSAREHEVLRLLVLGETVLRVADLLAITEGTVRAHVKAMLRKLAVSSQLAAVALYRRVVATPGWSVSSPDRDGATRH